MASLKGWCRKHQYSVGAVALAVLLAAAGCLVLRWLAADVSGPEGRQAAVGKAAELPATPVTEAVSPDAARKPLLTLDTASDYAALKAQLEPLAENGDALALRTIAQIYEYCEAYSVSPTIFREVREYMGKLIPENAEAYARIANVVDARCSRLDGGDPIPGELRQFSLMQAADAGDIYARIKLAATPDRVVSPEEIDALVDEALMDDDPQAILALGDLMAARGAGQRYAEFSGPGASFAWMVLACRRGGVGLCDQNSHLMTNLCLYQGVCRYAGLEDFVRREVFAGEQTRRLDQIIGRIQAASPAGR